MAEIAAQAFDQNDLCGRYMHPHRHEFPDDYIRFFRQEIRSEFFKPGVWFLVTTVVVGKEKEEVGEREKEEDTRVGERPKDEKVRVSVREKGEEVGKKTGKRMGKRKQEEEGERVIVVGAAKWKGQGVRRRRYSSWMNGMYNIRFFTFNMDL